MRTSLSRIYFKVLVGISLVLFACSIFSPGARPLQPLAVATTPDTSVSETPTIKPTETLTLSPTPTFTVTPTKTATLTPSATALVYGPAGFPTNVDPLTGQTVLD